MNITLCDKEKSQEYHPLETPRTLYLLGNKQLLKIDPSLKLN